MGVTEHSPTEEPRGFSLPLSLPRRMVCDLLHFAHKIPTVPVQRVIDIGRVVALRDQLPSRVGWCPLFTKAYARVTREMPELRRAYIEYPRPRLYQHPHSVASIAIERQFEGEAGVFFAHVPSPNAMPLAELERTLKHHKEAPVADVFGLILRFYKLPRMLRRTLWWYLLNVRGSRKAEFLGTFGVSVYSGLGAESLHTLSPLTTTLTYGVIDAEGRVTVRIVYDHRTLDGATVARALGRLEEIMNTEIAQELSEMVGNAAERYAAPVTV